MELTEGHEARWPWTMLHYSRCLKPCRLVVLRTGSALRLRRSTRRRSTPSRPVTAVCSGEVGPVSAVTSPPSSWLSPESPHSQPASGAALAIRLRLALVQRRLVGLGVDLEEHVALADHEQVSLRHAPAHSPSSTKCGRGPCASPRPHRVQHLSSRSTPRLPAGPSRPRPTRRTGRETAAPRASRGRSPGWRTAPHAPCPRWGVCARPAVP